MPKRMAEDKKTIAKKFSKLPEKLNLLESEKTSSVDSDADNDNVVDNEVMKESKSPEKGKQL